MVLESPFAEAPHLCAPWALACLSAVPDRATLVQGPEGRTGGPAGAACYLRDCCAKDL